MKLRTTLLVAITSSLCTAGALELMRSAPPGIPGASSAGPAGPDSTRRSAPARTAAGPPERDPAPLQVPPASEDPLKERIEQLEQRISALEQPTPPQRTPLAAAAEAETADEELRVQVLDWVAQEREARALAAEREAEEYWEREVEFDARYEAFELARDHELAAWQQERLVELLIQIETRRREVEDGIDIATDSPEVIEGRYVEFDRWAERYLEEELGKELYERLFPD